MTTPQLDHWASWIAKSRYGGNLVHFNQLQAGLKEFSDRIISRAGLKPGNSVLDVGTGDGPLGIRALSEVGEEGRVIFSDVSSDVVALCKEALPSATNCEFVVTSGETLSGIHDESLDAVVWRSVLPYSSAKESFFTSAYRVLKSGGTLSINEPINKFSSELSPDKLFFGFDLSSIPEIKQKLRQVFKAASQTMMATYSDKDIFRMVMDAGFMDIKMVTESFYTYRGMYQSWEAFMAIAPNPNAPTLKQAVEQVLSPEEREAFIRHVKPLVETTQVLRLSSLTFISAKKP
jgi:arsenite methyltransferase